MFTRDWDENNSSRFTCWTEPTDFRPAWIQTGMNVNTKTFQTGLGCNLDIGTTHANKSHLKRKLPSKRNKLKILWFSYRSHVNMLTISIFIPANWLRPGLALDSSHNFCHFWLDNKMACVFTLTFMKWLVTNASQT
jgi:hypothetical protein